MQSNAGAAGLEASPLLWNAAEELREGFTAHHCSLPYLLEVAHSLQRTLEDTRRVYNEAIRQRDEARARLVAAQGSLAAVERVVGQYASVKQPVVASDGFTYEHVSIREYLSECAESNTKAYSQLTKEELLDVVVPNETLSRLVKMLQPFRTSEVPPVSQRSPIAPFNPPPASQQQQQQQQQQHQQHIHSEGFGKGGATNNGLNWADDDVDSGRTPIPAAELEATLVHAANVSSLNASQSSNNANQNNITNNINNNNNNNTVPSRRWEIRQQQQQGGGYNAKNTTRKHPCIRVYGHCNFLDDCAFAHYPYEACLNFIKGKCRFGQNCKELHVNSTYPRYSGQRTNTINSTHNTISNNNSSNTNTPSTVQGEEREINFKGKRNMKEKESSKGSSIKGEINSKEEEDESQDTKPTLNAITSTEEETKSQEFNKQDKKEQGEQEAAVITSAEIA